MTGWGVAVVLGSSLALLLVPVLSQQGEEPPPEVTHGPRNGSQSLNLTRAALYGEFARELQAVLGAEPHTKQVFGGLVDGMKQLVMASVLKQLQRLVDDVAEHAEDAWMAAEDAGVRAGPCVDGVEAAAQSVMERALEDMKKCVEDAVDEGVGLAAQVGAITADLEKLLMSLVTAMEDCLKLHSEGEENKDTGKAENAEESRESETPNDWEDVDDSSDVQNSSDDEEEQQRVKECLKSEAVKDILDEKSSQYNSLKKIMQHVFETEKSGKPCIMQFYQVAKEETEIIKRDTSACVNRRLRDEL